MAYAEDVRSRALSLWRELKAVRDDPMFHDYGLAPGGPMYDWHQRREALDGEWIDYLKTLPVSEGFGTNLSSAISFMYPVAKDWAFTAGVGKPAIDEMVSEIEVELVY